jgi:uncharacterized membrane protein YccF (DUF307 family)
MVRPTSAADRAWVELAGELSPAKSLARVDAATARVVTTVTIVGSPLGVYPWRVVKIAAAPAGSR